MKKILIIGPIPPPAGGVSIHINRLAQLLRSWFSVQMIDESKVQKEGILNIRKLPAGKYLRSVFSSDIVHIHSGTRMLKYAHVILSRLMGKKTILTIHSYKKKAPFPLSQLDGFIYSLPHKTIIVTNDFNSRLKLHNDVVVKDAFLPPVIETESALPEAMVQWIKEKKQAGYALAVANAWRLDTHNGEDLYGLDICIEAAVRLKEQNQKVAFVFVVCAPGGHLNVEDYEKVVAEKRLSDIFYIHKEQTSFIKLIEESDIVLRPTNTDGDALTVREALFLNKRVIASDVVKRPEGTILFKTRSSDSLAEVIVKSIDGRSENALIDNNKQSDLINFYKDIYSNLN